MALGSHRVSNAGAKIISAQVDDGARLPQRSSLRPRWGEGLVPSRSLIDGTSLDPPPERTSVDIPMPLTPGPKGHKPRLVRRRDGRFEVRCRECERIVGQSRPLGIGMPITNRREAEFIVRNHTGRAA